MKSSFRDTDDSVSLSVDTSLTNAKKKGKVTDDMLTIYEYTALISYRAKRLRVGDPARVKWDHRFDPIAIAKCELEQRTIPVLLIRKIPDTAMQCGYREEVWNVTHMRVRDF